MRGNAFPLRLFGPGLPGGGALAEAYWQAERLHLTLGAQHWQIAAPLVDAAGFNAQHWRFDFREADGDYAAFLENDAARAAFIAGLPAAHAPHASAARTAARRLERRFRYAYAALAALVLAPILLVLALLWNADEVAGWLVEQVPVSWEAQLGDLVLAQTRAGMRVQDSGPEVDAVRNIGQRLTAGSRLNYRWFVAEKADINAFAAPGGVVVVQRGLLKAARSPEELAGVLAHEIAHAELRHSLRGMVKSLGLRATLALLLGDVSASALGDAAVQLTELKFSRDAERAADQHALSALQRAGIDPAGLLRFFEVLAAQEGKDRAMVPPALLSTHPATAERIADLKAAVAQLPPPAAGYARIDLDWAALQARLR